MEGTPIQLLSLLKELGLPPSVLAFFAFIIIIGIFFPRIYATIKKSKIEAEKETNNQFKSLVDTINFSSRVIETLGRSIADLALESKGASVKMDAVVLGQSKLEDRVEDKVEGLKDKLNTMESSNSELKGATKELIELLHRSKGGGF